MVVMMYRQQNNNFDVFDSIETVLNRLNKSINELEQSMASLNRELNHIEQNYLVNMECEK